jgi:hypothetical protein
MVSKEEIFMLKLIQVINISEPARLLFHELLSDGIEGFQGTFENRHGQLFFLCSQEGYEGEIYFKCPDLKKLSAMIEIAIKVRARLSIFDVGCLTSRTSMASKMLLPKGLEEYRIHGIDELVEEFNPVIARWEYFILKYLYLYLTAVKSLDITKVPVPWVYPSYVFQALSLVDGTRIEPGLN